jgi:hypothetical protein
MPAIGRRMRTTSRRWKRCCRQRSPRRAAVAKKVRGAPQGWRRQYGGFLRDGRRFIYGNFYPRGVGDDRPAANDWRHGPMTVCDGGHAFFGVEYDVDGHRFTHLDFNGYA